MLLQFSDLPRCAFGELSAMTRMAVRTIMQAAAGAEAPERRKESRCT